MVSVSFAMKGSKGLSGQHGEAKAWFELESKAWIAFIECSGKIIALCNGQAAVAVVDLPLFGPVILAWFGVNV